jgi:hypothetical protein
VSSILGNSILHVDDAHSHSLRWTKMT